MTILSKDKIKKKHMKIKIFLIAVIMTFSGIFMSCVTTSQFSPGSGNKYQYTYKLVSPVKNSNLLFQDENVIIQFKFDEAAIRFQLQNISESNITIDWSRASMGINDRYFAGIPVTFMETLYAQVLLLCLHSDIFVIW